MQISTQALRTAVFALMRISDETPGERGRRAGAVALALRSVERILEDGVAADFLRRRAEREIEDMAGGAERSLLLRLVGMAGTDSGLIGDLLMEYSAGLEGARRLPEADAVMTLAVAIEPQRADFALQAGRVARLQGDRGRALRLYRLASELDRTGGMLARLAAVGEAVIAPDPELSLSRVIRGSVRAGDHEAAAVGLEERARHRRSAGDPRRAARDFALAAARYPDAVDRARVAHQLADLFVAADDPEAAREALLLALSCGDRSQRDHARSRLHAISRDLGDRVGMRRWRSFTPPSLVSLSARSAVRVEISSAPKVARWRERVEARVTADSVRAGHRRLREGGSPPPS